MIPPISDGTAALSASSSAGPSPPPIFTTVGQQQPGGIIPPDTGGAVSPSFILTTVNGFMNVKDRRGNLLLARNQDDFWAPVMNAGGSSFDPHSFYDPFGQRFVIAASSSIDPSISQLLFAVTQTADPSGAWNLFAVPADYNGQRWLDFPARPGFNDKWVLFSGGLNGAGESFSGLWVFDKAALYAGTPRFRFFRLEGINPQGAETYDPTFPDAFFVQQLSGEPFALFRVTGAVGSEVISPVATIHSPIPVRDGSVNLPGLPSFNFDGPGLVQDCVYRNGSIWASQTVMPADGPLRSAIQWVQMDTSGNVLSFGRVDDPSGQSMFHYPSIAVNQNDNFLLGFSRFASGAYPSAAYALNAPGDAPGTIRDPFVYFAGQANYSQRRWGDFSRSQPDPVNDTDFWTVQQATASSTEWVTAWAQVSASAVPPVCAPVATAPRLDMKTRCSAQTAQVEDFSVRVFNWDTVPVSVGSLCVRAWAFEPVPLTGFQWNISAGRICSPGGTSCQNVNVTGSTAVRAPFPTCTDDPMHGANQMVTYCNTSTLTIPPNGGFWEPQSDAFRLGRNNPTMQNGNFSDDYSHFGTGTGGCGAFSTLADTRFFALLFNGNLVGESLGSTAADPNTGRAPCTCP